MANPGNRNILRCIMEYDSTVPEVPLHQYLMDQMSQFGDQVAFVDLATKVEWKYSELLDAAKHLAAGLQTKEGLVKGQTVAIALPNCAEYVISLLAVSRCGGVASLVNPAYTPRELEHVTSVIRPSLWICTAEFLPQLPGLADAGYDTKAVVVDFTDPESSSFVSLLKSSRLEDFTPPSFNVFQDIVFLPFSSGTTGLPKGVMASHHSVVTAFCQFKIWTPYGQNDINFGLLPMYHQYGCVMVLAALVLGSRFISMAKFSFSGMLQAIQDHKVTVLPLVPPIALLLARSPVVDNYDLSSIQVIISSAAPLSPELIEQMEKKFECSILQGYGMTETTLGTHFTLRGSRKNGSIGRVLPFYESKIADENSGEALNPFELGEICVRGPMLMKGYKDNLTATAETIDQDGWLRTGDIGYYDDEGWFFIVDRIKELIKYKGIQVAPSELEHLLLTHPDVADSAVIGIPDEMAGELPRAYVVRRPGSTVTEEDINTFIDGQVSVYKKLRGGIIFLPAIPKSASGKILRRELRVLAAKEGRQG